MVATQMVKIPMSLLAIRSVQPGDVVNFNVFVKEANKTLTRVYRVMTVDRINEIVDCVLDREIEMRV